MIFRCILFYLQLDASWIMRHIKSELSFRNEIHLITLDTLVILSGDIRGVMQTQNDLELCLLRELPVF